MDVSLVIKQRLEELGLEQRDLARAARVTESYVSQLMTQKKLPPAAKFSWWMTILPYVRRSLSFSRRAVMK